MIWVTEDTLSAETIEDILQAAKVDLAEEIPEPPICLYINGSPYGTMGNFSLITGKAKSKKTFVVSMALAAAVKNSDVCSALTGNLPPDKKRVIFIDTEQSKYDVQKVARRVLKLADSDELPENFEVYSMRPFTPVSMKVIDTILERHPDTGLLVIDGARDMVTSINDEQQATGVASWLLQVTEERQIHVITVLHQNKSQGNTNPRGHIGTELTNKAEMVVNVTAIKNSNISNVETEVSRGIPFQAFAIRINADGLPEFTEFAKIKDGKKGARKPRPDDLDADKHSLILKNLEKVFQNNNPKRNQVLSQIKKEVSELVEPVGETIAKKYLDYYLEKGYIIKQGKPRSPKGYYSVKL